VTTMTTKPPTPQGISRLLAKAGFERAQERSGGFNSEGFHVHRRMNDRVVLVNWWPDSSVDTDRAKHDMTLASYADVLAEAGYGTEIRNTQFGRPDYVIVTAGEDTP
jgi:hypothetical protein